MKLDAIFAPMRSESVDDMKTEIKIRGMGDIKLKPQVISKSSVDRNKLDEVHEQRRAARQQIAMPDKPAKFKRLKPKPKPKEPSPIKDPSPINEEPQQVTPSKDLINDQHDEPEEIVEIVENIIQDENPEFLLEETEELSDEQINERLSTKPSLPPSIGINGFDRMGRLIFRAAIDAEYDVVAVNDPFTSVESMVYSLKFDLAHSPSRRATLLVRESQRPGQFIVNDKTVNVLTEKDSTKIPWENFGVNYVIESNVSLNTFNDARNHLRTVEQTKNCDESDIEAPYEGVEKVLIGSPSPDAKSIALGVNDDCEVLSKKILSHASAAVSALSTILQIISSKFQVQFCSYTLLKAVIDSSGDIKCPSLGPSTHKRTQKWDFSRNVVPFESQDVDQGVFRILPQMRGKLSGIQFYSPVHQVSMFDVTIGLTNQSSDVFRDICLEVKRCSERSHRGIIRYIMKTGNNESSASCVFAGSPETVAFDAKSSSQIDGQTVKLILWFDNESGHAARTVDIVSKYYKLKNNCNNH